MHCPGMQRGSGASMATKRQPPCCSPSRPKSTALYAAIRFSRTEPVIVRISATVQPISEHSWAPGRPTPARCRCISTQPSSTWKRARTGHRRTVHGRYGSRRSRWRCATARRTLLREAALVIFTSGSTGQPKGVVTGHRRLADKLAVLDRAARLQSGDIVLVPLQLTFIFGLWVTLLACKPVPDRC